MFEAAVGFNSVIRRPLAYIVLQPHCIHAYYAEKRASQLVVETSSLDHNEVAEYTCSELKSHIEAMPSAKARHNVDADRSFPMTLVMG